MTFLKHSTFETYDSAIDMESFEFAQTRWPLYMPESQKLNSSKLVHLRMTN